MLPNLTICFGYYMIYVCVCQFPVCGGPVPWPAASSAWRGAEARGSHRTHAAGGRLCMLDVVLLYVCLSVSASQPRPLTAANTTSLLHSLIVHRHHLLPETLAMCHQSASSSSLSPSLSSPPRNNLSRHHQFCCCYCEWVMLVDYQLFLPNCTYPIENYSFCFHYFSNYIVHAC